MRHLGNWLQGVCALFSPQPRRRHRRVAKLRRPVHLSLECLEDRSLPAVVGTGLYAQYFTGRTLTSLASVRTDAVVNLSNTANQSPAPGVGGTNYSVRWSGQIQAAQTAPTTLYLRADDGVRMRINGALVVNDWTDHGVREYTTVVNMVAGQRYNIEIEFYQNTVSALCQLSWSTPTMARTLVPTSALYANDPPRAALNAPAVTANGGTSSTFTVTYTDSGALDLSSIDAADVRVVSSKGVVLGVSLVGTKTNDAHSWTATYRVTPPGGTWDAADVGTYTVSQQLYQVRDTQGAAVSAGTLGSFAVNPGAVSDWFSQNLVDDSVEALARSLAADKSLSRADMLAIFHQVESNGVSAAELGDLRKLVGNSTLLGMPDSVRNLANKVVNADPANALFQGKALGNLYVGSSAQQIHNLVDKWFRGADRPATDAPGLTYTYAAGTLFGSGPSYADIKQGKGGDCYFVAALAEVAFRSPQKIRDAIIDNGDGTFTVRFFNNGVADYVTVDRYLPTTSDGKYWYAGMGNAANNAANKLWVGLMEKAYAQLAESGWSRGTRANAYAVIRNGWEGYVVKQLVNVPATAVGLINTTATLNAIVGAQNGGKMVTLDSKDATASGIVPNHAYVVLGYNAATQTFNLWNPWGYTQQLSWAQVAANFDYYSVG